MCVCVGVCQRVWSTYYTPPIAALSLTLVVVCVLLRFCVDCGALSEGSKVFFLRLSLLSSFFSLSLICSVYTILFLSLFLSRDSPFVIVILYIYPCLLSLFIYLSVPYLSLSLSVHNPSLTPSLSRKVKCSHVSGKREGIATWKSSKGVGNDKTVSPWLPLITGLPRAFHSWRRNLNTRALVRASGCEHKTIYVRVGEHVSRKP